MTFFSLQELAEQMGIQSNLPTRQLFEAVETDLNSESSTELVAFIDLLKRDENLIFYDWVMTDQALRNLLLQDHFPLSPKLKSYKGHLLEQKFLSFISHFLSEKLLLKTSNLNQDFQPALAASIMAYGALINDTERIVLHQRMQRIILDFMTTQFDCQTITSEEAMLHRMVFLKDPAFIACVNYFDKSLYSLKVELLKRMEQWVKHPQTTDFVLKVFRSNLLGLELNPGHKEELERFLSTSVEHKAAKKFNNSAESKKKWVVITVALATLTGVIFLLVKWGSQPSKTPQLVQNGHSGLDSLRPDELEAVDTLLGLNLIQKEKGFEPEDEDDVSLTPSFVFPAVALLNDYAKSLHSSMIADYGIQENMSFDKECIPVKLAEYASVNYEDVEKLDVLSGPFHKIKNESDYLVYMLLFDNVPGGKLYGRLIPQGGAVNVGLKQGQFLFFYVGQDMAKYNPAMDYNHGYGSIQTAKEVDRNFNYHYCGMDYNTLLQLGKIYKVGTNQSALTSTLSGDYYSGFVVNSALLEVQK
jgi:hypothetical protein